MITNKKIQDKAEELKQYILSFLYQALLKRNVKTINMHDNIISTYGIDEDTLVCLYIQRIFLENNDIYIEYKTDYYNKTEVELLEDCRFFQLNELLYITNVINIIMYNGKK